MMYHYVAEHQYRPPDEYIQAILATPVEAGAPQLRIRRPVYHPWRFLTAEQIASQYKTAAIRADPRWSPLVAESKYMSLKQEVAFNPLAAQMVDLLNDPQYDREP